MMSQGIILCFVSAFPRLPPHCGCCPPEAGPDNFRLSSHMLSVSRSISPHPLSSPEPSHTHTHQLPLHQCLGEFGERIWGRIDSFFLTPLTPAPNPSPPHPHPAHSHHPVMSPAPKVCVSSVVWSLIQSSNILLCRHSASSPLLVEGPLQGFFVIFFLIISGPACLC